MVTVKISYDESKEAVARVEVALNEINPVDFSFGWNGTEFKVERDDFTSVESDDEIGGTKLLHSVIYPALQG